MNYTKPKLECFGSLRQLTQLGFDADCDGGVNGISGSDGADLGEQIFGVTCTRS
ncbi:MAG: hypothetical protein WEF86_15280 [Gemmatimonadota bacterium]